MYNITVHGTGYVGLVGGVCLACAGNNVKCFDINEEKINALKNGVVPIHEPGLETKLETAMNNGNISFTNSIEEAVDHGEFQFISVGTPQQDDGSSNLSQVRHVARNIGSFINDYKIVIDKSTVPIGTAEMVRNIIEDELNRRNVSYDFDVVSNPEFLKEGAAVNDFQRPDRIIIGLEEPNDKLEESMRLLYRPFNMNRDRILVMDIRSAEMAKYASNAMLATKISFINDIANVCENLGADIEMVRRAMGMDKRIGPHFIYPGTGYGGSCFPKDVLSIIHESEKQGYTPEMLKATVNVNDRQKYSLVNKVESHYDNLEGKKLAVWGLSFKPNTDDMREAPSLTIIPELVKRGVKFNVYDPIAIEKGTAQEALRSALGDGISEVNFCNNQYEALEGCDGLLLVTEWDLFRSPDFAKIKSLLKKPVIFDGRNQYNLDQMKNEEINYHAIGRPIV